MLSDANNPQKARLPKFKRRPEAVVGKKLTPRSLAIISAIARYRFLPTSLLVRLVDGNEDVTHRHLQQLFHKGLINRFAFPRTGGSHEFNYYLDNPRTLAMLVAHGLAAKEDLDFDEVRGNKEKGYHKISSADESSGQALFLHHELMISRFHFMLEKGCLDSDGKVELAAWKQGAPLHGSVADPDSGGLLPHRPDAFFTLRFPRESEGPNRSHFFYEADRNRTSIPKMLMKLKAHREFIQQKQHQRKYGINRLRAVLVETLDIKWAEALRQASIEVCSAPLFWFTAAEIFTAKRNTTEERPLFLHTPGIIFRNVWAVTGKDDLYALD